MDRAAAAEKLVLDSDQLSRFRRAGYLLVEGVLDPALVIEPLFAEYATVLDRLVNELHARGELASTYNDLEFSKRLIRIYRESGRDHSRYFDPSLITSGVTPDTPFWAGPAVFRIITHERVLDLVECLIGPEIYSNPVQHIRIKPPERLLPDGATDVLARANPWHQDNGVVDPVADGTDMLTVWIALSDAPVERGCLQVIPRSHRKALRTHCPNIPGRPLWRDNQGEKRATIRMRIDVATRPRVDVGRLVVQVAADGSRSEGGSAGEWGERDGVVGVLGATPVIRKTALRPTGR